jgi:hypothetical protein
MSLWGTNDSVASGGTIKINLGTGVITGSGTSFSTAGVAEGDVIQIGAGVTYGEATIISVSSNTVAAIASSEKITSGITTVHASATYVISQRPISTLHDSNYGTSEIYGVDATELGVARAAGVGTHSKFAPTHTGWVGIQTYTDMHGVHRRKKEVLVAGGITGDAEDAVFADS